LTEKTWLDERFAAPDLDSHLVWHCPPPSALTGPSGLTVATAAGTDFWQGTHYGFRVDNGHALLAEIDQDFVLTTHVRTRPVHQYDQAGLMVRLSPSCWLKTSVEFEPGSPSRLGAVVTNHGWSDWSTQDVDPLLGREVAFRVSRQGADYLIEAATAGHGWSQLRIARLHDDTGSVVRAGLYACSPKAAGFEASFAGLMLAVPQG
jgi:uncharacterized protein